MASSNPTFPNLLIHQLSSSGNPSSSSRQAENSQTSAAPQPRRSRKKYSGGLNNYARLPHVSILPQPEYPLTASGSGYFDTPTTYPPYSIALHTITSDSVTTTVTPLYPAAPLMSTVHSDAPPTNTLYSDPFLLSTSYSNTSTMSTLYPPTPLTGVGYLDAPPTNTLYSDPFLQSTSYSNTSTMSTLYPATPFTGVGYFDVPPTSAQNSNTPTMDNSGLLGSWINPISSSAPISSYGPTLNSSNTLPSTTFPTSLSYGIDIPASSAYSSHDLGNDPFSMDSLLKALDT